jgi:hypothetical protein
LPAWNVTAIEIAVDLAPPRFAHCSGIAFVGPGEPRICLVAGFALSSQLDRILCAVKRELPARLPSMLRISPPQARSSNSPPTTTVSIAPMLPLLRLQSRLARTIEPGLAEVGVPLSLGKSREMDEAAMDFVRDFISSKALPSFEPVSAPTATLAPMRLRVTGITLYQLDSRAAPNSILGHWPYERDGGSNVHLSGGP